MVKSAVNAQQQATNGLKILLGNETMTQVQATWRFLNNPNVTIKELYEPLINHLEKEIHSQCDKYVLALEDWSHVDYKKHIAHSTTNQLLIKPYSNFTIEKSIRASAKF